MPKSIQWAVGAGGRNLPADVATIQYLLNCVPTGKGGPVPELAVDGLVGPKTIGAIRKFQVASFGRADGRVDPGARTIETLQAYDPYPNQPMEPSAEGKTPGDPFGAGSPFGKGGIGQKTPGTSAGKQGSGGSGGKSGTGTPWLKGGGAGGKTGF